MRLRFWGTRGSLAKPGPSTLRYGGNTSCIEVTASDGTLVVLDCGTGAHELGGMLLASGRATRGFLLISHTHWDHIQGFPFFAPLFIPGNQWEIYAPGGLGPRLEETLAGQMEYQYFPITLHDLAAQVTYHEMREGEVTLGGFRVRTQYLNHPALTLGYRLEADGASVVYAVDHEPHSPEAMAQGEEAAANASLLIHEEDKRHIEFLAGADLVIHDAQFTADEYAKRVSWGHSPIEYAVDMAMAAQVKRLALFHHDPLRSDVLLDELVEAYRQRVTDHGGHLDVFGAAEGQSMEVGSGSMEKPMAVSQAPSAVLRDAEGSQHPGVLNPTVLIVDDDADTVQMLMIALRPEGYRLLPAYDGDVALALAKDQHPDLVLLDWDMPRVTGLEVARALRGDADPALQNVPILMLTGKTGAAATTAGFASGVSDYITKAASPAQIRSRVRAWLLRRGQSHPTDS